MQVAAAGDGADVAGVLAALEFVPLPRPTTLLLPPPPPTSPFHHQFKQEELVVQVEAAGVGVDVAGILAALAEVDGDLSSNFSYTHTTPTSRPPPTPHPPLLTNSPAALAG